MNNDAILKLFRARGAMAYDGEGVSQLQHAWQCGRQAAVAGASDELRLAAWLHDLGHLVSPLSGTPTLLQLDDQHESVAGQLLCEAFGDAVGMPVHLHVQAKRYLVAVHPVYRDRLSPDSLRSLALQGGPMSEAEVRSYRAQPWADDALRLRAWDDIGKLAHWQPGSAQEALQELAELMDRVRPRCAATR